LNDIGDQKEWEVRSALTPKTQKHLKIQGTLPMTLSKNGNILMTLSNTKRKTIVLSQ
jgi:hypothetical protein